MRMHSRPHHQRKELRGDFIFWADQTRGLLRRGWWSSCRCIRRIFVNEVFLYIVLLPWTALKTPRPQCILHNLVQLHRNVTAFLEGRSNYIVPGTEVCEEIEIELQPLFVSSVDRATLEIAAVVLVDVEIGLSEDCL
jgi:hypothetical protein